MIHEMFETLALCLIHIVKATQNNHGIHFGSERCPNLVIVEVVLHRVRHVTNRDNIDLGLVVDELRHDLLENVLHMIRRSGIFRNGVFHGIVVPTVVDQTAPGNLVTSKLTQRLLSLGPPPEVAGVGDNDTGGGVVGV